LSSDHIAPMLLLVYMKLKSDPLSWFLKMAIANERLHEINISRYKYLNPTLEAFLLKA
jgi:hypothetical protein